MYSGVIPDGTVGILGGDRFFGFGKYGRTSIRDNFCEIGRN